MMPEQESIAMTTPMTRRSALGRVAGGAAFLSSSIASLAERLAATGVQLKGRVRHSVCKWCYPKVSLDDLCREGKTFGLTSVELLEVQDFETLKKHDMVCAMVSGVPGGITTGLNRLENHDRIAAFFEATAPKVAAAGFQNIICFSGNRAGMSDEQGLEHCAIGLKRIVPICEKYKVLAVMELLNSKVNHPDYMCDHTMWGVELCKRVGSEHFKLLYDIYHMQIMEGDMIATIQKFHPFIAHYHTGGVPGRHEIDDTQEINYSAVMKAIVDTGFKGHVAQEFVPARPDVLASLKQGVTICDV
jgi:hydroxypyruvate isomerase